MSFHVLTFASMAAAFTLLGGSLPLLKRDLSQRALSLWVAFSAGALLSTGLNHMVVESYEAVGKAAIVLVGVGFILLYLIEKVTMIHACQEEDCETHTFGGFALAGIGFHGLLDGFAIAVSLELSLSLGFLVGLAVLSHRFPTGVSIASIMLANAYPRARSWRLLGLLAGLVVLGAGLGLSVPAGAQTQRFLGLGVALSAGTFIYIATADLLPLAHHRNIRDYWVPAAFLGGFSLMLGASYALG